MKTNPVLLLIIGLLFCSPLFAQFGGMGNTDRIDGKFKFVPLPFIDYDVSLGLTLGLIPMGMFNISEKDTISPSSSAGLAGIVSGNGTWFGVGFAELYMKEDRWRSTVAFGGGDVNFQYYLANPINKWVPYTTGEWFIYASLKRRVYTDIYAGLSYFTTAYKTTSDYYSDTAAKELHSIGIETSWDKRSNVSYPISGHYLTAEYFIYPKGLNEQASNQIRLAYNKYHSFRQKKDVLAWRLHAGIGIGDLNFNQQFIVGQTDIRGYSKGKYRGNYLISAQGEYRFNFHPRMGLVGFFGVATVFESINANQNGKILPGIGTGFRYTFMKDTHSNIGFDIAQGDGDWSFNFRFSEAF